MAWDGMDARGWVLMKGAKNKIKQQKKAATDHLTINQEGVRNQQLISQGGRYVRQVLLPLTLDTASAQCHVCVRVCV